MERQHAASARLSATQLRQDVYRILDAVTETGQPVDIERRGTVLRISRVDAPAARHLDVVLVRRDVIAGNPDDLSGVDWSDAWRPSSI